MKYPKRIVQIIRSARKKGEDTKTITIKVNNSATAKKLGLRYSVSQISGKIAHL